MKFYLLTTLLFMSIFSFFGMAQDDPKTSISVTELKERYGKDTTLIILDVRMPQELTSELGQIKGVINIPLQVLTNKVSELEKFRKKEIAVICRSGNRSRTATKFLLEKGFNAKNVPGGMMAYRRNE
ncbi:MAG: rhodanese-like domain-containing protein [Ignavibacteria bacterium]|nr:rhodanese-like domain-containing protein [Ignavibacteria bacterium]